MRHAHRAVAVTVTVALPENCQVVTDKKNSDNQSQLKLQRNIPLVLFRQKECIKEWLVSECSEWS